MSQVTEFCSSWFAVDMGLIFIEFNILKLTPC